MVAILRISLLLLILWPGVLLAQQPKAGVVTTLHGTATVARVAVPEELPLKFKDDVLYRDRIATKENSIVRVLLGGKALVTVRELSVLTITEEPGRATVDLQSGKIALAVARKLMRPGETIEIRTPNAVASVRGTVVIAEIIGSMVLFSVPSGLMTVTHSTLPGAPTTNVPAGSSLPVTPSGFGTLGAISPAVYTGLTPPPITGTPSSSGEAQKIGDVINVLFGGGGPPPPPLPPPPTTTTVADPCQVNTCGGETPPTPTTDLSVSKVASITQSSKSGNTVTYTILVTNNGPDGATGVTLTDPLPAGVSLVSASSTQGSCGGTSTVTCSLGSLANGGTATVTIVVKTTTPGAVTNSATASDQQVDPSLLNNAGTVVTNVPTVPTLFPVVINNNSKLTLANGVSLGTFSTNAPFQISVADNISGLTGTLTGPLVTASVQAGTAVDPSVILIRGAGGAPVNVFELTNSELTSSSAPLFSVTGPNLLVDINTLLRVDPSTLTLGGSLLSLSSATLTSTGPLFSLFGDLTVSDPTVGRSSITQTGTTDPLINVSSATLKVTGDGQSVLSLDHSDLTLAGPYINSVGSTINVSGPLLRLKNGSTATNTAGPAFKVVRGSLMADALAVADGHGNALNLAGSLLDLTDTTVTVRTLLDTSGTDTVSFTAGAADPLIRLVNSTLTQRSGAGVPLLQFSAGTVTTGQEVVRVEGAPVPPATANLSLTGPLVRATGTTFVSRGGASGLPTGSPMPGFPRIWEPNFGPTLINCDDCTTNVALGFSFPFQGRTFTGAEISSNGFLSLGGQNFDGCCNGNVRDFLSGFARLAPAWFDLIGGGGVHYRTFPDRVVVTWDRNQEFCCFGSNTLQLQLLADGRIVFGNASVNNARHTALVGVTPGGGVADPGAVDFSRRIPFSSGSVGTVYELFLAGTFDLSGNNVVFTPNGLGGWDISSALGSPFVSLATGAVVSQSGGPFVELTRATLTSGWDSLLHLSGGSSLTAAGTLLDATDSTVTLTGPVARLEGGSTLRNRAGPVIRLSGGSLTADALGISDDTGNTFDLTGTLLDLSSGASVTLRTLGEEVPNNHTDTVNFNLATHEPLIKLSSSHLTLTGAGQKELVSFGVDTETPITQNGVALIATGTSAAPSTISLKGRLLDLGGVNLTDTQAQIQLSHTTVTQTGSEPLIDVQGLPVTMNGPMLYVGGGSPITGSKITTGGPVFHFGTGTFMSNTTDELVETGAGDTIKSSSNFLRLDGGASVSLKGTFLNASGSTLCSGSTSTPCSAGGSGAFINVTGGASLKTMIPLNTLSPLIFLSGGSLTAGGNFLNIEGAGSKVEVSGQLLSANGTAITTRNNLVRIEDGGSLSLNSFPGSFLMTFQGGSYMGGGAFGTSSGGALLRMFSRAGQPGTSLSLTGGPYLTSSGGAPFVSTDAPLFNIADGATITTSTDFALFGTGSATSASHFFRLQNNTSFGIGVAPMMTLDGTLIGGANFRFATQNGGDFLRLRNGVTLDQTGTTSALVALTGTNPGDASVTAAGHFLGMTAASPAPTLKLGGSLLSAVNASLTNGDPTANVRSFLFIGDSATLTGPSNQPLLSFSGSSVDTAGDILTLRRSQSAALPSKLTLSGPLLVATNLGATQSTFNTTSLGFGSSFEVAGAASCCDGFAVRQGAQLAAVTASPLVELTNSTFNAGPDPQSGGGFFAVSDTGAPDTIVPPLQASVTLGSSTVTAGSLLTATNSTITALFDLVRVTKSSLMTNSLSPLVELFGGTLTLGGPDPFSSPPNMPTDAALFRLKGSATGNETVEGVNLIVGTDQPLRHTLADAVSTDSNGFSAPLLQTTDATVSTPKALKIDTALLVATAPLFNFLKGTGAGSAGSNVTFTNADPNSGALDLSMKAKVTSLGSALVRLDGSSVTVNKGHFVNVAGGSLLSVAGDLVHLMNGSSLTIKNGTLLNVTGNSVAQIGTLVRFSNSPGNTSLSNITVTNTIVPTPNVFVGGFPVFVAPGGTLNVTNATPIVGVGTSGTVTVTRGGSLLAVAGGSALRIGP